MLNRPVRARFLTMTVCLLFCFFVVPSAVQSQQITVQPEESLVPERRFSGVNVSGDTEICEGAETTLKVDGEYESYEWSNGSTERSITIKKAGVYEVTVKTKGGCSLTTSLNVRTKICI
jgi:hypothetical protein